MTIEQIAQVCHAANTQYCSAIGDNSQLPWDQAEEWQRQSAVAGVKYALDHPEASASAQHEAWMQDKKMDGWAWGPVKNPSIKQHPCIVPYTELPLEQRLKDYLFVGIVRALSKV